MHTTYGLDPKLVDDDVRFRTTYYFRTFDYCWDADPALYQFNPVGADGKPASTPVPYRRIIPKTDSLYRYRMTGQASALFSRIRFESGVLKASAIDPFGTQVTYSRDADGFHVRSNSEVKADAEAVARADADRTAKLEKLTALTDFYLGLPANTAGDIRTAALATITSALEDYRQSGGTAPADSAALKAVQTQLEEIRNNALTTAQVREIVTQAIQKVEAVAEKSGFNQLDLCPVGAKISKGFQIMGPEGLKTFDQDDRLVMAMSSSASPLIETLQEYSGRILDNQANPSGQLLALANENLLAETARRKLADAVRANPDPLTVLDDAITTFGAKSGGTKK